MNAPPPRWLADWRGGVLAPADALAHYDRLPGLRTAALRGRWRGAELRTGHRLDGLLPALGWWGKAFRGDDDVDPLLFATGRGTVALQPARMPLSLALAAPPLARSAPVRGAFALARPLLRTRRPAARLREIVHRGVASAAMLYDRLPIVDHFRRIDEARVLGLMDLRDSAQPFFFLLERD
ncbi:DUF4334 domain-containing protein [Coralloluteibacterium thermophilus]|uniref:DUF4334 domain-containing protein n=1 Tax=Coralloluteibacterium thermophilum TaxID=2707049 RepID=A0ABV9NLK7_9GAMM